MLFRPGALVVTYLWTTYFVVKLNLVERGLVSGDK